MEPLAIRADNWELYAVVGGVLFAVMAGAAVLCVVFGRVFIPWLVAKKINDGEQRKASEYLNMLHADKKNTPTMGGAFMIPAVLIACVGGGLALTLMGADALKVWGTLGLAAFAVCGHAALGLYDDYCKLTRRGTDGISGKKKLVAQTAVAALVCTGVYFLLPRHELVLPMMRWDIGPLLIPFGVFVMVGASNAYNLTDGLDGLAGGTGAIAFYALGGAAALFAVFGDTDPSLSWTVAVLGMGAAGGLVGFLFWNRHPARVFMGDTGSLSLGALLGFLAVAGRLELLLAVAGGVFVAEAASVILQVGYFKLTKGRRILRCAPLHHHFQFGGWPESKVTRRFWKAGMLCAVVALALCLSMVRGESERPPQPHHAAQQPVPDDAVVER